MIASAFGGLALALALATRSLRFFTAGGGGDSSDSDAFLRTRLRLMSLPFQKRLLTIFPIVLRTFFFRFGIARLMTLKVACFIRGAAGFTG